MKKLFSPTLLLLIGFVGLSSSAFAQSGASTEFAVQEIDCAERECLIELIDDYFNALVAHNPELIPFADNVRFVENIDAKPIGEGLWQSASAVPSDFKIYIADPVAMQVAFLGMMEENGEPLMISLRLRIQNGQVTEVEHILARNLRESSLANLQTPRSGIMTILAEDERMSRHELVGIAYSYYDALNFSNGELSPMADDCERHENGMVTVRPVPAEMPEGPPSFTLMGCQGQLTTGVMAYIDDLDNRRVLVVDQVTGLAYGLSHFRHAMENKIFPIYGVPGVEEREINFDAFDLPAAHVFKIRDGWIHEIEAMGFTTPYNSASGW